METLTEQFDAEKIYQDFYPKVYQYLANRMGSVHDAEDMAQTVFLKIYTKLDTFDASKSSLSTWIFNITRNSLIDHLIILVILLEQTMLVVLLVRQKI